MLIDSFGKRVETNKLKDKRIIMYGASTRNQKAIEELGIEKNVVFFVDSNEEKNGQVSGSYKIYSPSVLNDFSDCIILSVLVYHFEETMRVLNNNGIKKCLFYYPEFFDIEKVFLNNREILQIKRDYKYIHVFSNDKFVIPFYEMLEEQFNIEEHLLVLAYRIKDDYADILSFCYKKNEKYQNILILDDVHGIIDSCNSNGKRLIPSEMDCNQVFYSNSMKGICKEARKIILHSAIWGIETKKFLYDLIDDYSQKMEWICFGADALFEKNSFEVSQILRKIGYSYIPQSLYKKVKADYEISYGMAVSLYYIYISKDLQYEDTIDNEKRMSQPVNILLGHSAFEFGNHKLGLDLLKKYKNENIQIYCPLSYGSAIYRNQVIQMGEKLFGSKFIPMTQFMKQCEYYRFLNTIDVALFPMVRLAAESTLQYLNAISTKIYMNKEILNSLKTDGIQAEDILKMKYQSFSEFIVPTEKQCNLNDVNNDIVIGWSRLFHNERNGKR